jgi:hypothetical protein
MEARSFSAFGNKDGYCLPKHISEFTHGHRLLTVTIPQMQTPMAAHAHHQPDTPIFSDVYVLTEKEAMGAGAGIAGRLPAAQRRHGLPRSCLHRSVPVRRRRRQRRSMHVAAGPGAAGEALGGVRQQRRRRRLPALQAHLPAAPAPLLRLRPRRALQSPPVQVTQLDELAENATSHSG